MLDVLGRAVDELDDGALGLGRLARGHGVEHRAVQRQGMHRALGAGGGDLEARAQQRAERLAHLHQHAVVGGPQQPLVEAQVVADVVAPALDGFAHAGIGRLEPGKVLRVGALRREPHRRWLDDAAQLLQVAQEVARQPGGALPGDELGVEPVPVVGRQHPGAELRPGDEHALGHERLHGLAHHRAAHPQRGPQRRLGRQGRARRMAAGGDRQTQGVQGVGQGVLHRWRRPA